MATAQLLSPPSTADPLCFKINATTLKFETREDLLPYLQPLIENPNVEEVHLGGSTYGIEACKFLGEILATKKKLKVHSLIHIVLDDPFTRVLARATPISKC
jgi:Ran GTPase-activating protein (RanGAP) involved in mRNA processing and transport